MPGVVLNGKEKIRGNFKENRTLKLEKKKKAILSCIESSIEDIRTPVNFIRLSPSHLAQIKETHP